MKQKVSRFGSPGVVAALAVMAALAALLVARSADAAEVRVLTTGAFKPIVTALVPDFERQSGDTVIVFNDTATGMIGRAVWTNENGEEAYSELRGEGTAVNNKITGTFVGGTGRYAGITGDYEFSWRFLIENEDGNLQGQSLGLKGRVRLNGQQGGPGAGGGHQ